jgi:hypothetical protein
MKNLCRDLAMEMERMQKRLEGWQGEWKTKVKVLEEDMVEIGKKVEGVMEREKIR